MALVKCKECRSEVSSEAKSCPKCGAKPLKKVGLLGWIVVLFVGFFVYRCSSQNTSPQVAEKSAEVAVVSKPKKSAEEITKDVAQILKGFKISRDKIEKVSFYTASSTSIYDDHLSTYLVVNDSGRALLRIRMDFHGDTWIFWDRFKAMSDDVIVFDKSLSSNEISRDNNTAGVFESADFPASQSDLVALKIIANSKKTTIRMSGRDKQTDFDLSQKTIDNLKETLVSYEKIKALSL